MPFELNLQTWGSGAPTVLLLHGLGDGAFVWSHVAPALAKRETVAAVELRGHGDSPHDPHAHYAAPDYAGDVLAVMASCGGSQPMALIGHSLGATVALHVAAIARERVDALVLVDGGPGLNAEAMEHIHRQFVSQPWLFASVESYATELLSRYPLANPLRLWAIAASSLRPLPTGGYELKCDRRLLEAQAGWEDAALWRMLESFDGPALVVRGAASSVLGRSAAAHMARVLEDGRWRSVPLAGHAVMLDNPDELLVAIESFLIERAGRHRQPRESVS